MIPSEVEDRISRYYFQHYLPDKIMLELEEKLLPFYLEDEKPQTENMVKLALTIIDKALD